MVAMAGSGSGYLDTIIITLYMYTLIYRALAMLRRHGSLCLFSGQGEYANCQKWNMSKLLCVKIVVV